MKSKEDNIHTRRHKALKILGLGSAELQTGGEWTVRKRDGTIIRP